MDRQAVTGVDWRSVAGTVREIAVEIRSNHITFMAGSIAHSAFLSLLPLLVLILIVTAAIGDETLNERILHLARVHLSPTGESLVFEALTEASDRAGASLFGVVSLLWGMLRVFRGVGTAFDELYGDSETGFLRQLGEGLVVFVAILVAVVGTAAGVALLALQDHPLLDAANAVVLLAGLMLTFFPMYYVFPDPEIAPSEAVPGTVVAAVGWVVLEGVFGLYVAMADTATLFGLLGSIIILLVWLYGVSFVLLAGATVNVVLAGRHRESGADEAEPGTLPPDSTERRMA